MSASDLTIRYCRYCGVRTDGPGLHTPYDCVRNLKCRISELQAELAKEREVRRELAHASNELTGAMADCGASTEKITSMDGLPVRLWNGVTEK